MTSSVRQKMAEQEKEKKVAQRLSETPVEMVRARNENESWIEKSKVKKKAVTKKKTTAKKSK